MKKVLRNIRVVEKLTDNELKTVHGSEEVENNQTKNNKNTKTINIKRNFDYENAFMLSAPVNRIGKFVSRVELYNKTKNLPGEIIECGVFKGSSLSQFAKLRSLYGHSSSKKIIAFDTFGSFPVECDNEDKKYLKKFINKAGNNSIEKEELIRIFKKLGVDENLNLVKGDILKTLPKFLELNSHIKISLLHIDVDTYKPTKLCLELLYPHVVKGGIIILDDYGAFPGANRAIDNFFKNKSNIIEKLSYSNAISYVVK